ncbi:ABC transporter ATP-binding protein [bacterium SCSIO 12741]|nr:ABC transporter ATP-binding protein [bacterium SCSIO 12741]
MSKVSGKIFDFGILSRTLKYVRPYRSLFTITGTLVLVLALLGPVRPVLIQYTLDNTIIDPNPDQLLIMTMVMIGLLLLETLLQFFQTYLANWVGQSVIKDLRMQVYQKISAFKLKYFDNNAIGTLVTRVISDIETIADVFSNGILIIIGDLLKLIAVIFVMFYTDWFLALLSLASIPLLILVTRMFNKAIKSAFTDVRTQVARLNAFVQEHITGMNVVQIFSREVREMEKFKAINREHRNAHIRTVWANAIFFPAVELLSATSMALLVWFGSKGVIEHQVSFGNLVAFILYINMLFRPIRQLADRFNTLQMGIVSSDRVFKVIDTDSVIEDKGEFTADELRGNIDVEGVWLAYKEENYILRDLNFSVKAGQTVAFVGATGAGKTSVINLLCRTYEFQKGQILLDGKDIRSYSLEFLRSRVGVVLQDVFLFSDSILNNITLGNPDISLEEVREAARKVGADQFIMNLPGGYSFNPGERGATLSVGQRQLLAFIRAYVYNPDILILDEATSSIDTESEEMIQKATEELTRDRTSIIIAHRLATIQNADTIFVMDQGRMVESGNHQELLDQNGLYKNLYEVQFKEEMQE